MKLINTRQLPFEELRSHIFDAIISASGYETRARHVASYLDGSLPTLKRCLHFTEVDKSDARIENDIFFEKLGFAPIDASSGDALAPEKLLRGILDSTSPGRSIVIDITSMTRVWYAAFINVLRRGAGYGNTNCYFTYSPSKYIPPAPLMPNENIEPLEGFCNLDVPNRPTALVIGLGYERGKALALKNYIDPAHTFAFLTEPAFDAEYLTKIRTNNKELLEDIRADGVIAHPAHDLELTAYLLSSLVDGLVRQHKVILAPLGIKPFTLLCLLLSCSLEGLDVWRVTSGTKAVRHDHVALGPILVYKAVFDD